MQTNGNGKPIMILIADDDADDRMMAKEALDESRLSNEVHFVEDGVELLSYLRRQGRFAAPGAAPRPDGRPPSGPS